MADIIYDLAEARLLLGREAARHGDWSRERHAAAAELFRELASIDQAGMHSVKLSVGLGAHPADPHWLRLDFVGGQHVVVRCDARTFHISDPAGVRPPLEVELDFNAFSGVFETHEADVAHPGMRRSAATLLMRRIIQQLRAT